MIYADHHTNYRAKIVFNKNIVFPNVLIECFDSLINFGIPQYHCEKSDINDYLPSLQTIGGSVLCICFQNYK